MYNNRIFNVGRVGAIGTSILWSKNPPGSTNLVLLKYASRSTTASVGAKRFRDAEKHLKYIIDLVISQQSATLSTDYHCECLT